MAGPLAGSLKALLVSPFISQRFMFFLAKMNQPDLDALRELLQAGNITPVIDRRFELADTAAAIRYIELGHARGKVIVSVE